MYDSVNDLKGFFARLGFRFEQQDEQQTVKKASVMFVFTIKKSPQGICGIELFSFCWPFELLEYKNAGRNGWKLLYIKRWCLGVQ